MKNCVVLAAQGRLSAGRENVIHHPFAVLQRDYLMNENGVSRKHTTEILLQNRSRKALCSTSLVDCLASSN